VQIIHATSPRAVGNKGTSAERALRIRFGSAGARRKCARIDGGDRIPDSVLRPGSDMIGWAWRPDTACDLGGKPWHGAGACL
jgi:hypothetical protein